MMVVLFIWIRCVVLGLIFAISTPSTTSEIPRSQLCSIPLLCDHRLGYSYPHRNTTELLIRLPQYPVDAICLQVQPQHVTSQLTTSPLHCYDSISIEWVVFALPSALGEGYYFIYIYTYQQSQQQQLTRELMYIQHRRDPEYDSALVQVVNVPYGMLSTGLVSIPLINTQSPVDFASLNTYRIISNNEVLTFSPTSYDVQYLHPAMQVIGFDAAQPVESASFFFQVYFLQYQGMGELTSIWPVRNTLPTRNDLLRRIYSHSPSISEEEEDHQHWRVGRGDQGYLEVVLSPEAIATQRFFQSYFHPQQQQIVHRYRKAAHHQRQHWFAEYYQQLQVYFNLKTNKPSNSTTQIKHTNVIELCMFTSNQLDGQKQIWIQQMKHLPSSKFHATFIMGFDQPHESYAQDTLSDATRFGSNSMYRILHEMMMMPNNNNNKHNIRIVDNTANRAGISEHRLMQERASDESSSFGQQWDYQNFTQLYEYIHHRFEVANMHIDHIEPMWCRDFYQAFVQMMQPLQCDVMILGNMKGFTADVFILDVARFVLQIPMLFELTSFDLHPMMLPDVIIAPSHFALFEPTVQLPLQQGQHATGRTPVFTVISPSIDFNHFNPKLYINTSIHPPLNCPLRNLLSIRKYEPCVVIAFVARVVPGKSPGLFLQAAYHILKQYPFARFRILGSSTMDFELKTLVKRLDLSHVVDFVGFVDPVELPAHLSDVDIVLNPSLRSQSETFCIANIEVMSMNIPLVTFAIGGIGEYVTAPPSTLHTDSTDIHIWEIPTWEEGHNAIVVNVADPQVIAEATLYLVLNPEAAVRIGTNGRNSVLEQFSVHRQMTQYEALYEALFATQHHRN